MSFYLTIEIWSYAFYVLVVITVDMLRFEFTVNIEIELRFACNTRV